MQNHCGGYIRMFGILALWFCSTQVSGQEKVVRIDEILEAGHSQYIDSSKALDLARKALALSTEENYETGVQRSVLLKARVYGSHQRVHEGIDLVNQVLNEEIESPAVEIEANQIQGYLLRRNREYAKALAQDRKTIAMAGSDPKSKTYKGRAQFNRGYSYRLTSQYDSAMAAYVEALRTFSSIPDSSEMIIVFRQIGNIHLINGNLDDALNTFELNSKIARAYGDSLDMSSNVLNIGVVYHKRDQYEKARANYRKAIEYAEGHHDHIGDAIAYGNIGSSMMEEGNPAEGLPYLLRALKLKEDHGGSPNNIMHTLFDLSQTYRLMGDYSKAKELANQVIDMAEEHRDGFSLMVGYEYLAAAEYEEGKYKDAYDHHETYMAIKDSIFNEEKSKQIKELEIQYESEIKDQAIATLEQARELERSRKVTYLIIGLAILLIGSVLFNRQRLKSKKNKELLIKEQEVDRLKSDFFANVSHEFRTPLTLILGPIQTRISKCVDPAELSELKMMERNALRLQRLINDILDLAKFESGKLELQPVSADITKMIRGVAGTFNSLAEAKSINYRVDVDDEIFGFVDKGKLETILINLLSNAFKHTPEGQDIEVRVEAQSHLVEISVRDSGSGISEQDLPKIFDRFYQVDDTESRKKGGTGIGLAFTSELVKLHGSELAVESSLGQGSCFSFRIPYFREKYLGEFEYDDQIHHSKATSTRIEVEEISKEEIDVPIVLLTEDNADVRTYIESILGDTYHMMLAPDGRDGLAKAIEYIPDLVISDVMMPEMDGYELCAALKSDIRTAHIPIILLTAKASIESRVKGLEMQADSYISKPFNPKELELQVKNLLNLKSRLREQYILDTQLIPEPADTNSMEQVFLEKLGDIMEKNYQNSEFTAELLGKEIGISRSQLHRKLKALVGESTTGFIRTYRLKIARKRIENKTGTISEIAYQVGFNSISYFNKCFREKYGLTPSQAQPNES